MNAPNAGKKGPYTTPNRQSMTPKGERTRRAILDAAIELITREGMAHASQDQIAKHAGISQSTLRHYFRTKEELISAIHLDAFEVFRHRFEKVLLEPATSPWERIRGLASTHLKHITQASDAYNFETFAYFARNASDRARRDDWYHFLIGHYCALIQQIHPQLDWDECETRGFHILTLCLGCWLTLGKSRPKLLKRSTKELNDDILEEIKIIVYM